MGNPPRKNPLVSLCGLNGALCPMHLGGYCPGCGGGPGDPSCAIAHCGGEHGVEFCFACGDYPCVKYEGFDEFDFFLTHRGRAGNLERALAVGTDVYLAELVRKQEALAEYNDGRRKTFYCAVVSLLELSDVEEVMEQLAAQTAPEAETAGDKARRAVGLFEKKASERGVEWKLRKKPRGIPGE